jgi:predicted dehydrogenase
MSRLRLAVIGVGHLGKEHARILSSLPDVELVGVADVHAPQAQEVARRWNTRAYSQHQPLLQAVDAAVIVTPTTHHHAVAGDFLQHGIPILVEKPLAATLNEADELVHLARRHGALLQVGHIERFNPAFEELQRRPLQPKYVNAQRVGPFTGRSTDIGAVLDLMIHDLDLLLAMVRAPLLSVQAMGLSVLGGHEDMAQARLTFEDGCVADLTASRLSPEPLRRMQVWGPEGLASLDFAPKRLTLIQPSEELCRRRLQPLRRDPAWSATLKQGLLGRHLEILELDRNQGDQLTRELEEFVQCVRTGARPRVSGEEGRDAIRLASQILDSMRSHAWETGDDPATGPHHLPAPRGRLFEPLADEAAA